MNDNLLGRVSSALLERRIITGSLAILLLAVSLALAWQWERQESAAEMRQATAQARILAGSLSGALAFDDVQTVQEYLNALKINQRVKAAGVYGSRGRLIAGYTRQGEVLARSITQNARQIEGGELAISVPVTEGDLALGHVYLRSAIEPFSARLSRYAAIGIILILAALLIMVLGESNAAAAAANRRLQEQVAARETAEKALVQAQKMEALGQLTGGVAHDFNNLLMAASSGLALLERAQTDERRAKLRRGINEALERGARITEQLLAFSRRRPLKEEVVFLARHIANLADLLDHSLRENISVDFSIPPDVWPIKIDVAQFDIAILNLAVNAKDAMPKGGKLCISARNLEGALERGDGVEIAVEDDGAGMPPALIEQVFEPFFTTKEAGRGTGLGLSQVYGFAQAAGGRITIKSTVGQGTEVALLLPRCEQASKSSTEDREQLQNAQLAGATILMVEDDAQLNELVGDMLEEAGAKVYRAQSAAEGLRRSAEVSPDIVLSDMVMPGEMDGLDLARNLRERWPALPIVLMTGYSEQATDASTEGYPLLRKPFKMTSLVDCLARAMQSSGLR